jgi:hypothetical protein
MSIAFLALTIGAALVAAILLARYLSRRSPGGYRRRFDDSAARRGEAFPMASTLYVGDGGSASHSHHHQPADCMPGSDAGGGCSDGGGGS